MSISYSELAPVIKNALSALRGISQLSSAASIGCTPSILQFEVLNFILENVDPTTKQVATELGLSMPSMSQLAKRMLKAKLIERGFSEKDKRTVRLKMTSIGRLEHKRLLIYLNNNLKTLFNGINELDLDKFLEINSILSKNIKALKKL